MSRATPASTRPAPQPLKCLSHKRSRRLSPLIQPSSLTHALALRRQWRESALLSEKCGLGTVKRQLNKSLVAVGRPDERGASGEAAVELNALRVDSSCCSLLGSYPRHKEHCGLLSGAAFQNFQLPRHEPGGWVSRRTSPGSVRDPRQLTVSYVGNNNVWEASQSMTKVIVTLEDSFEATRLVLLSRRCFASHSKVFFSSRTKKAKNWLGSPRCLTWRRAWRLLAHRVNKSVLLS